MQVKNYFNISFKIQQLVYTKNFNIVAFKKLQLSNINLKCTLMSRAAHICHQRRLIPCARVHLEKVHLGVECA